MDGVTFAPKWGGGPASRLGSETGGVVVRRPWTTCSTWDFQKGGNESKIDVNKALRTCGRRAKLEAGRRRPTVRTRDSKEPQERQNSRHDAQAFASADKDAMTCCRAAVATRRFAGHTSQA